MSRNRNQKGFALVEGLLITIIVLLIGFIGYYVWHANQKTEETLSDTSKSSTNPADSKKLARYFIIKEWGVRAAYASGDTDTYSYSLDADNELATVTSDKLIAEDPACAARGAGFISRYAPGDDIGPTGDSGVTAAEAAKDDATTYKHIGSYYYAFRHEQAACGDVMKAETQMHANDAVKTLVTKLEITPNQ